MDYHSDWYERFPVGVGNKKTSELLFLFHSWERPLRPEELPYVIIPEKPRKSWPDSFRITNSLLVVRDPVRSVIEELDPGKHQFFPVAFQTKRGKEIEGPWFIMFVHAKQDSIVMERSRINKSISAPDKLNSFYSSTTSKDIVVAPARQSGLNLWSEQKFRRSLLGSDELMARLDEEKLSFYLKAFRATDLSDIS